MITHWYVGFVGDHAGRKKPWFDIFSNCKFRHCLALAYDPDLRVWISHEYLVGGLVVNLYDPEDFALNALIAHVKNNGLWLRVRPSVHNCWLGRWPMTCVTTIKHLVGLRSCALTPKGLYRDLVRDGAKPAFEA